MFLILTIIVVIAAVAVLVGRRHTDTVALPPAPAPDTPTPASQSGWEIDLETYPADHPQTVDARAENLRAHAIDPEDPLLSEDELDELNESL